ncbi:MAG: hypothetical protein AAGI27_17630, partial [Pseudomonadota bacterium]
MIRTLRIPFTPVLLILLLASCTSETETVEPAVDSNAGADAEAEDQLVARAMEIHDRVLTLDTHADTPLRMIEPGFSLADRHDPNETGSKLDYPRMQEGGLDAVFLAAFVA